ncbi:MAG: IS4 family transposase, partial [Dechloromonas sp.]|nr:IS4 family transposase [Dechloromonas sp.]
ASLLFAEAEWKGAYILAKAAIPETVPTIRDKVRQITRLGGFLGRKCDGEPGVKTLWLGIQRLRDFVKGMEHMQKIYNVK